jgi:hypothetical protein
MNDKPSFEFEWRDLFSFGYWALVWDNSFGGFFVVYWEDIKNYFK